MYARIDCVQVTRHFLVVIFLYRAFQFHSCLDGHFDQYSFNALPEWTC
jgi:hypothetical protein